MKIEIELEAEKGYVVRANGEWADHLTPDEALWMVVCLMTGQKARYLKTTEENAAWNKEYRGEQPLLGCPP